MTTNPSKQNKPIQNLILKIILGVILLHVVLIVFAGAVVASKYIQKRKEAFAEPRHHTLERRNEAHTNQLLSNQ